MNDVHTYNISFKMKNTKNYFHIRNNDVEIIKYNLNKYIIYHVNYLL